ncbi:hypothetical protein HDF19_12970 [Mucilaginibacter sp. E4BP6]|uniref:hypothetical protein n=1 Tax=Mucilaginibacter sp. E4BP6 TaxID=2723089 RepID=UPI0015CDDBB6|nr:hypothetical protein [Mucilaginibacter sp. E4BP6]NYE64917.1 hypothetical protein [Mucilaginibacter sp. E4BP6]
MILHFFTWQQFLVAAVIFTVAWYTMIFFLFFRGKLTAKLHIKTKQPEKLRQEWEEELAGYPDEEDDLIVKQALPEGISEVEAHLLGFSPKVREHDDVDDRETQLGVVPDVLEELKTIFHILENEGGTAEDFVSLFGMVKAKYPGIRNTPNEAAINDYIRENLPFGISDDQLANLWN